jgi:MraZ protein
MAYLFGEYEHTMDDKGRVSMPARFRKELPRTVVLAPGPNGQVNVFSEEGFVEWLHSLFEADGGYSSINKKHVRARQYYNEKACSVDIDSAGRINVPASLREYAGLSKTVLLNGDEDHVCIWDKDRWNEYIGDFDPSEMFS